MDYRVRMLKFYNWLAAAVWLEILITAFFLFGFRNMGLVWLTLLLNFPLAINQVLLNLCRDKFCRSLAAAAIALYALLLQCSFLWAQHHVNPNFGPSFSYAFTGMIMLMAMACFWLAIVVGELGAWRRRRAAVSSNQETLLKC
jgi:hypothetical protein